jgi:hypothetical protein
MLRSFGLACLLGGAAFVLAAPPHASADTSGSPLGDNKPFTLQIAKKEAKAGQAVTIRVAFRAAAGWHINKDFPTTLNLTPPQGVTAPKAQFNKQDVQLDEKENEGHFDVTLVSSATGKKTIPGTLKFAVCSDTSCDPQKTAVSIEMNVQ